MAPGSGRLIAWFAVYDGHGGTPPLTAPSSATVLTPLPGDRVAKYAGEHVHEIVRKQEAFEKEDYVKALQDGFVGTDTALLEGMYCGFDRKLIF
jgi:protein phosphatase PTC2/3